MNLNKTEHLSTVEIGGSCDEASCLDAALSFDRINADEVEGDVFEDGKVVGGMTGTGAHLIVGEDDIHAPMQAVLHGLLMVSDFRRNLAAAFFPAHVLLVACPPAWSRSRVNGRLRPYAAWRSGPLTR
jgi:hypothetical protein